MLHKSTNSLQIKRDYEILEEEKSKFLKQLVRKADTRLN